MCRSAGRANNLVEGNLIGTDNTGTTALPNGQVGVMISASSTNTIGGTTSLARNVISGNSGSGVSVTGTATAPATGT